VKRGRRERDLLILTKFRLWKDYCRRTYGKEKDDVWKEVTESEWGWIERKRLESTLKGVIDRIMAKEIIKRATDSKCKMIV
jgi:hypothetical protein